ncbi:transcriptional regulator, LacI family [Xylanimonas cellulosilytica DSM 15894]|uniref:Transcriptional regulator, LacI family n=1 Tax=Xylanimonas cellulosilytica (strain DSM 15894 / JCM 12276 / CECT 5975 / KCTC 9989 / LMG 20990 / NBRC 107835 / XIL07) TaxID=446471 RepID=D1BUG0_XYLCX|nr:LacI family DNA-binding transcriptional regulator [Xylanimonas cellulosilytica]ACZ31173.1 transcriptional regulator, LacI family [Xylanimonas cellulosilytica DSM 15894]
MTNPGGGGRRPTIKDVAAAAGTSRGTVSRVLNGGHWVSPQARAAVESAIRSTGYRANPHARSLASGRSGSIAFLLTEQQHRLFEDPVFSLLLRGTTASASAVGLQMVMLLAQEDADKTRVVEYAAAGHVDGVMLISRHRGDTMLTDLLQQGVPTVTLGVPLDLEGQVSTASADDRVGGRRATEHLLHTGRRRIATITGPMDTPGGALRLAGYRDALGDDFDESLVAHGDYLVPSGRAGMTALLDRAEDIDGVFAHNDLMAIGAIEALHDRGRRVPDDVGVIGFDDSGLAEQSSPTLTTMRQPFDRLSAEMVRLLMEAIEGAPPATVMLPATLIERESA